MAVEVQEWRAGALTPEEHAEMRRVRQIIIHLSVRDPEAWGDPLDGALAALNKIIRTQEPTP